MPEAYAPRVEIDLEHGRSMNPEPAAKPLEMWEITQRDQDARTRQEVEQAEVQKAERKEQARETLRTEAESNPALTTIAGAILELIDG